MRVQVKDLGITLEDIFGAYNAEATEAVKKAVQDVGTACRKDIKEHAPKKTGKYRKSWKKKTAYDGRDGIRIVVYSSEPELPHLLEFGHAKRGGNGRVDGRPHIYPAAKRAETRLSAEIKKAIEEVGK